MLVLPRQTFTASSISRRFVVEYFMEERLCLLRKVRCDRKPSSRRRYTYAMRFIITVRGVRTQAQLPPSCDKPSEDGIKHKPTIICPYRNHVGFHPLRASKRTERLGPTVSLMVSLLLIVLLSSPAGPWNILLPEVWLRACEEWHINIIHGIKALRVLYSAQTSP